MILLPWRGERELWLSYMRSLVGKFLPCEIVDKEMGDGTEYANFIADHWTGQEDLILVEHDVWPTQDQWSRLLDSPHLLTVYPYTFNKDSPPHWAVGLSVATHGGQLKPNEEWADGSGIGLIKVSTEAQRKINLDGPLGPVGGFGPSDSYVKPWRERHWGNLDGVLSLLAEAQDIRFHVLWPQVEHRNTPRPEVRFVGTDGTPAHWHIEEPHSEPASVLENPMTAPLG